MTKEEKKAESEKEFVKTVTEGPEMDKEDGDARVDQLSDLVDRCVKDNMQIHIIAQKVGILNATFENPMDDLDIIDLMVYARDSLDKKNNTSNPASPTAE